MIFTNTKQKLVLSVTAILITCITYAQPDLDMNESLRNNSDSWKVKAKQRVFSKYRPASISFGPVNTIEAGNDKSTTTDKKVEGEVFYKTVKKQIARESNLTITYNETDTISINILSVEEEAVRKRSVVGVITGETNDEGSAYNSSSIVTEMTIRHDRDTGEWHFIKTDSSSYSLTACFGVLYNRTDSFFLQRVNNFSGKKMKQALFSVPATGFAVFYKGQQVAVMQTSMKNKVWLSKDLNETNRIGILAAIAGLFATIKSETDAGI